jgi:cell division protein FtsI (penicillin-binding protein 3)
MIRHRTAGRPQARGRPLARVARAGTGDVRWRPWLLAAVLASLGVVAVVRIAYLNVYRAEYLQQQSVARSVRTEKLDAMRGMLRDRRGEPLAVSTPVDSIWVDPHPEQFDGGVEVLRQLAAVAGGDAEELAQRVADAKNRRFVYLYRRVPAHVGEAVRALGLDGVHLRREYRRYYPAGEVTAHVVGLTNVDDAGIEGSERAYQTLLAGTQGEQQVLKDRAGRVVRVLDYRKPPVTGRDVHLAIDLRLQYAAYRELKRAVVEHGASAGAVVVLDARSGEVLALASQPSFNPNRDAPERAAMRNRAVSDPYEPGSTLKPFAVVAALESGLFTLASTIDTSPGWVHVGNKTIEDPRDYGVLDFEGILARSSQVGISKVAVALPEDAIPSVLARVGLGSAPGLIDGEAAGTLPQRVRSPLVRATLAYGHGLFVTPVQLARAFSVLANEGVLKPVSLQRVEGEVAGEQVIDAGIARQVAGLLESVTDGEGGTGQEARVPGYRVAGKTGTVRKVVPGVGYDKRRHVTYFAGFAPASAPRVVIAVVVDDPRGSAQGGGDVAAPVFSRIATVALRLLEVPPDGALGAWGDAA